MTLYLKRKLGHAGIQNNTTKSAFSNLFSTESACLSTSIVLSRYVKFALDNQDNFTLDNDSDIKNDDSLEIEPRDPNRLDDPDEPDSIYD